MSASTIVHSPWIINRRQDLTWFIGGSAVVGFFLLIIAWPGGALPARDWLVKEKDLKLVKNRKPGRPHKKMPLDPQIRQ